MKQFAKNKQSARFSVGVIVISMINLL